MATNDPRPYLVQVGKGKGNYTTRYSLDRLGVASAWYDGLHVHSGYKKRLLDQDGNVIRRLITWEA